MLNVILRGIMVVPVATLFVAMGGSAVAAATTPSPTLTVQDDGVDGAGVDADGTNGTTDADGTQGDYKPATDGSVRPPIEDAVPQLKAGHS